ELPPILVSEAGRALLEERLQSAAEGAASPKPTPAASALRGPWARLRRPRTAAGLIGGAALLTLGAHWLIRGPGRSVLEALRVPAPTVATADTLAWADTAARADIPIDTITLGAVVNPQDSLVAAAFTVQLVAANSVAGANSSLVRREGSPLPAATIAPVQLDGDGRTWYRALVGAWQDPQEADRFLEALRRDGSVDAASGRVLRAPYALQLAEGMATAEVPAALARWSARGVAAYALRQDDGRVRLLAGAFETPDQAAVLAVSLRDAGVPPLVVFRIGRTF
ncbi:MAG: SPOR domain-containing protein, partial [Gemmatimonadaceae bacterium]